MAIADYLRQRPTTGINEGIVRGVQLGTQFDKQALLQAQAGNIKTKQEAAQALQSDLTSFANIENKTVTDWSNIITKHPSLSEHFKRSYDILDDTKKQNTLNQATKVYAAVRGGNLEVAKNLLGDIITSAKNANNKQEEDTAKAYLQMLEINPKAAETSVGLFLASTMGVDKFSTAFKTLEDSRKTPSNKKGTSDFERIGQELKEKGIITEDELLEGHKQWWTKKQQPAMASLQKDIESMRREGMDMVKNVGVNNAMELASVDTREWTPEQKAQGKELSLIRMRALKPKLSASMVEKISETNTFLGQTNDAFESTTKMIAEGEDVNLISKFLRDNLSKYFSMDEEDIEKSFRDSRFQGASNTLLKIASGTAVNAQEWERFKAYAGTAWNTNKQMMVGMETMTRDQFNKIKTVKSTMGDISFNLQYGDIYRGLSELQTALKETRKPSKASKTPEERFIPLEEKPQSVGGWKKYQ